MKPPQEGPEEFRCGKTQNFEMTLPLKINHNSYEEKWTSNYHRPLGIWTITMALADVITNTAGYRHCLIAWLNLDVWRYEYLEVKHVDLRHHEDVCHKQQPLVTPNPQAKFQSQNSALVGGLDPSEIIGQLGWWKCPIDGKTRTWQPNHQPGRISLTKRTSANAMAF